MGIVFHPLQLHTCIPSWIQKCQTQRPLLIAHEEKPNEPEPIISPVHVVAAVSWELRNIIEDAQKNLPDTGHGRLERFVTDTARSLVLQWVHFARHPGANQTLSFLQHHF